MIPFYNVQIELMKPYFSTTNNLLCFDCKTGHMPQLLSANMKVVGLDSSKDMIKISKEKYPNIPFIQGECDPSIFKANLFTHIYCPLFSINTKDVDSFFECVDKWLVSKGFLFIITYDRQLNVSQFTIPNSIINYNIEITNTITEKIIFKNKKRTNIQYLKPVNFDYYNLINKIKIPNYSCYLNIYQKI
jgi:ubiquinone/menaquinone biosynthesis C-methylase UbiE